MGKDNVRDAGAQLLERLPDRWFEALRRHYASSAGERSLRSRGLGAAVAVSRHRRLPDGHFRLADPDISLEASDSVVARMLYWYGSAGYEGAEARYWRRACTKATSVLELGANIGYYSVVGGLANPDCSYRTVEPHPASADAVRRNLAANGVENVEVIEAAAVGTRDVSTVELSVPSQDHYGLPAGAFLREDGEGVDHLGVRESFTVDAVAMQDLIEGVDLLKLDIEGHEADVLEPVLDVIVETKPTLFLEVRLTEVPRLRQLILRLATSGFVVFAIGEESLHLVTVDELEGEARLPRYGSRDLVLVPNERVGDL